MPAQQCRRGDNEGTPTRTRQQSAGNGEQHPVDGGDRRTARGAPKDGEFLKLLFVHPSWFESAGNSDFAALKVSLATKGCRRRPSVTINSEGFQSPFECQ